MIKLFEKLLNLIYYRTCAFCGKKTESEFVCAQCYSKIRFINEKVERNDINCDVYVSCIYEKVIKKVISDLKYHGKKYLADFCAKSAEVCFKKNNLNEDYVVIPVPLHNKRKKQRKYNHMDIIVDKFCKNTKLKSCKDLILRIKDTEKQFNLDIEHRINNMKDAFIINPKKKDLPEKSRPILIMDDIVSSGATLNETVSVLKKAGYTNITALIVSMPELRH